MQGLAILIAAGCLGQFLHYAKKAMRGQLWGGDTEPNPFTLGFWRDFWSYLFIDHPGATAAAFIASAGSAFVLGDTVIDVEAASTMKLLIAGAATGYIADSVANNGS